MDTPFLAYLQLLDQLRAELVHLTDLAKKKTAAARTDDLMALDEIMRQEQAAALAFRGLEQKQAVLLKEAGLVGVPLASLPEHYPADLRQEARKTTEALRTQYQVYQKCAEVARNTLEINLHEIDKFLANANVNPVPGGPGYEDQPLDPPKKMRTDFRA